MNNINKIHTIKEKLQILVKTLAIAAVFIAPTFAFAGDGWDGWDGYYYDDYALNDSYYYNDYALNDSYYYDDYALPTSSNDSYYYDDYALNDSYYYDDYALNDSYYYDDYALPTSSNDSYYYDDYALPITSYSSGYQTSYPSYAYSSGYVGSYSMPYSYGGYSTPYYGGYNYGYNYNTGCTSNCNRPTTVVDNTQPLNGSCSTSGSYNKDQTVVWRANASGGNGNYTYSWSGDVSGSGSNVSKSYSSTGTKNATVTITSGSQSITRDCSVDIRNNNNNNDLSAICRVSDTRIEEGDRVTFEVEIDGGDSPYEIDWRGDVDGSDDTITKRFNDSGTYHASVRVRDDSGNTVTDDCSTIVVDNNNNNNNSNITLVSNGTNTPTNGTLASGVFLSDIPYTGVAENLKMTLFVLGMTLWSAFMAWVFLKKKAQKAGMTQREMIEKFKRENLERKLVS